MARAGIGSFFPYPDIDLLPALAGEAGAEPWPPEGWGLYNSGRAALRILVEQHLQDHPHAQLWMPSYYCWDVTRYVSSSVRVQIYPCIPSDQRLPATVSNDDLLLVASYFGAEPPLPWADSGTVVLDTTHDPMAEWIDRYPADWVFGSIRKTLPLPEGGYAYARASAGGRPAFNDSSGESLRESLRGAMAMTQKARWIDGDRSSDKDLWYAGLQAHERAFADLAPAAIQARSEALLRSLPVRRWRRARLRNLDALRECLNDQVEHANLPSTYGLPLVCPSRSSADRVRKHLLRADIYAARIWPQPDQSPPLDLELADRTMLLHTDFRYTERDMERVASVLRRALAER